MTPWVLRIIIANLVIFVLQQVSIEVTDVLMLRMDSLLWRPWTLVTYMFVHGGFNHIFWNMLGLYFFGPILESRLGGANFIRLYLLSGIVGGLCWIVFTAIPGGMVGSLVGASGGVFGVQLGFAYFWPRQQIYIMGIIPIEARWLIALLAVASLYFGIRGGGGIAHFAHLGGFLGGYLYLKYMERRQSAPLREWQSKASISKSRHETAGRLMERLSKIRRDDLHEVNRTELDRILDKISATGISSLTPGEREFLDRFSSRLH